MPAPPIDRRRVLQLLPPQYPDAVGAGLAGFAPPPPAGLMQGLAQFGLGLLPGSGDAMAAQDSQRFGQDMVNAARQHDFGRAASSGVQALVAGAGALPMVPFFGSGAMRAMPKNKVPAEDAWAAIDDIAAKYGFKPGQGSAAYTGSRYKEFTFFDHPPGRTKVGPGTRWVQVKARISDHDSGRFGADELDLRYGRDVDLADIEREFREAAEKLKAKRRTP